MNWTCFFKGHQWNIIDEFECKCRRCDKQEKHKWKLVDSKPIPGTERYEDDSSGNIQPRSSTQYGSYADVVVDVKKTYVCEHCGHSKSEECEERDVGVQVR